MRNQIKNLIQKIEAIDLLEREHIAWTLDWIDSGEELFRLEKPATPPKHLVAYCVLIDGARRKILLADHIKSGLWLPTGGHVEKDEEPKQAAIRELKEELGISCSLLKQEPLFLTVTSTTGLTAGHTDISLWYVFNTDSASKIDFDKAEFNTVAWYELDDSPKEKVEPHLGRFIKKLNTFL